MAPRLIIDCHSSYSGNAGLVASLLKEYGIEYTEPSEQVIVAIDELIQGVLGSLAELVATGQIASFKVVGPPTRLPLREALEVATNSGSIVPGAINLNSYVYYDEEWHVEQDRPYTYIPDLRAPQDTWHLTAEQLERIVLNAAEPGWMPTSNLVI